MFRHLHIPHGVTVILNEDLYLDSLTHDDEINQWGGGTIKANGYRIFVGVDAAYNHDPFWNRVRRYLHTIALCCGAAGLQPGQKIVYPSLEIET